MAIFTVTAIYRVDSAECAVMLGSLAYSIAAPMRELTCYAEGVVRHYARRFAGVLRFELRPLAPFRVGGEASLIAAWTVMEGEALTRCVPN